MTQRKRAGFAGGDPYAKYGTFDWEASRKRYEERLQQDIDNGIDNVETRAELDRRAGIVRVKPKVQRTGNRPGPKPLYDRKEFVRMYLEGMSVVKIARHFKCADDTVREAVRKAGVYDPKRDVTGGQNSKDKCKRGHDMNDPKNVYVSTQTHKDGKSYTKRTCRACRRLSDDKR